jgi:hypothetical protein
MLSVTPTTMPNIELPLKIEWILNNWHKCVKRIIFQIDFGYD